MNIRRLALYLVCLGISVAAVGCDEEGMIVLMGDGEPQVQTPECEGEDAAGCSCNNGEWRCLGDEFQICLDQTWNTREICEPGECIGKINDGILMACKCNEQLACAEEGDSEKVCVNSKEVSYGTDEPLIYQYGEYKSCEVGLICSNGRCLSLNECNTPMPQDDKKWKCEDNTWVLDNSCDVEKDKNECVDGKYKACIGGEWQVEDCNGERQCKDNKCIECDDEIGCGQGYLCKDNVCMETECDVSDALKCVGETIWNCQNGKWVNGENCSMKGRVCENGVCVTCHNGQTRCDPDNKSVFQLCENNEWKFVVNCGDKQCDGTRIGTNQYKACDCEVGNTKPGNGNNDNCYFECNGGIKEYGGIGYKNYWVGLACNDGFTCVGGGCIKDGCSENTYKCDGNSLMKCNGGMWSLVQSCGMGQTCNAKAHRCECTTGSFWCLSEDTGNRKYCKNGEWTDDNCKADDICSQADGGACVKKALSCEKDKTICKSRTEIMGCSQGRWKVSDIKCNGTNEVCGQKGNDAKCVNMITGGGTWECDDKFKEYVRCDQDNKSNTDGKEIRKCDHNRKWMKSDSCDGKTCGYRNKQIQCVEKNIEGCIEYSYTCGENGKKIKFCINNELRDFADCSSVGLTCIDDGKGQAHCGKNN